MKTTDDTDFTDGSGYFIREIRVIRGLCWLAQLHCGDWCNIRRGMLRATVGVYAIENPKSQIQNRKSLMIDVCVLIMRWPCSRPVSPGPCAGWCARCGHDSGRKTGSYLPPCCSTA